MKDPSEQVDMIKDMAKRISEKGNIKKREFAEEIARKWFTGRY